MEGMFNYFIPDDGDSPDHLNVFPLPKDSNVLKLQDVEKMFPLPGKFHFRFKQSFEGTYVWLDLPSKTAVVPKYNGLILCKVSRVNTTGKDESTNVSKRGQRPSILPESEKVEDLIRTSPKANTSNRSAGTTKSSSIKTKKEETPDKFNNDLVGLLSDPTPPPAAVMSVRPSSTGPTPPPPARPVAVDPFSVFNENRAAGGGHSNSSSPSQSPVPPPGQHNFKSSPYAGPMGQMLMNSMGGNSGGTSGVSMNQMNTGMNRPVQSGPGGGFQPQQNTNPGGITPPANFHGLQWQGMGQQQQQQRGGTPPPRRQQNW